LFDIFNTNNIVCYNINKLQREKKSIGSKDVGANAKFAKKLHFRQNAHFRQPNQNTNGHHLILHQRHGAQNHSL
jgi:hypothetical protein